MGHSTPLCPPLGAPFLVMVNLAPSPKGEEEEGGHSTGPCENAGPRRVGSFPPSDARLCLPSGDTFWTVGSSLYFGVGVPRALSTDTCFHGEKNQVSSSYGSHVGIRISLLSLTGVSFASFLGHFFSLCERTGSGE